MKQEKKLSTVQKLNKLSVGTYIKFIGFDGELRFLKKIQPSKYTKTTYGNGIKPIWIDINKPNIYWPKTRIPSSFEVITDEYSKILELKNKRSSLEDVAPDEMLVSLDKQIAELEAKLKNAA